MSTYTDSHKAYYQKNKEKIIATNKVTEPLWLLTPKGKYSAQKRKAKQRGIFWDFTFDTWWTKWEGYWELRGDTAGKYCLSRYNDTGVYSPDNTYINLFEENSKEVYIRQGIDSLGRIKHG